MKKSEIKEIFETTFKGKNIMTPDVVEYGKTGDLIFEISEGTGFNREPIFGVTVLDITDEENPVRRSALNKLCHSLEEAQEYASDLDCEEVGLHTRE